MPGLSCLRTGHGHSKAQKVLLVTSRQANYFNDMSQWNNRESYLKTVELTDKSGCLRVGIDNSRNQVEYPFQALLRERNPGVRFFHTGVTNSSAGYTEPESNDICAVLCMDCAGDDEKLAQYQKFPRRLEAGRFVLFLRK
jgi:hypothetical protein